MFYDSAKVYIRMETRTIWEPIGAQIVRKRRSNEPRTKFTGSYKNCSYKISVFTTSFCNSPKNAIFESITYIFCLCRASCTVGAEIIATALFTKTWKNFATRPGRSALWLKSGSGLRDWSFPRSRGARVWLISITSQLNCSERSSTSRNPLYGVTLLVLDLLGILRKLFSKLYF